MKVTKIARRCEFPAKWGSEFLAVVAERARTDDLDASRQTSKKNFVDADHAPGRIAL